jgi:hypothetical protein
MLERVERLVHGRTPFPHAAGQGVPHDDQGHPKQDLDPFTHEHVPDTEDTGPRERPRKS